MFITDTEYFKGKLITTSNTLLGYFDIIKYTKELINKYIDDYDKLPICNKFDRIFYSYAFMVLNKVREDKIIYKDNLVLETNDIFEIILYYNRDISHDKNEMSKIEFSIKTHNELLNEFYLSRVTKDYYKEVLDRDNEENMQTIIIDCNCITHENEMYADIVIIYYAKLLFKYFYKDFVNSISNNYFSNFINKILNNEFDRFFNHIMDKHLKTLK